jgi:hypothetical protein
MKLLPFLSQHLKTVTRTYVDEMNHPDGREAVVEQVWESIVSWATVYTMALPTVEPAARPAGTDDLYLPGPEDADQCIKKGTDPQHLEVYRQHHLHLRDRQESETAERMRLAALLEDRLDAITRHLGCGVAQCRPARARETGTR